jgi:hypothetical protein
MEMDPIGGIADFRRDNVPPIRRVCSAFVALCRDLHLLDDLRGGRARGLRRSRRRRTLGRRVVRIAAISSIDTSDTYVCPVGKRLTHRTATEETDKVLRPLLDGCLGKVHPQKDCTPSKQRRVAHRQNEAVLDRVQVQLDQRPDATNRASGIRLSAPCRRCGSGSS